MRTRLFYQPGMPHRHVESAHSRDGGSAEHGSMMRVTPWRARIAADNLSSVSNVVLQHVPICLRSGVNIRFLTVVLIPGSGGQVA
jgi:hypothetical protein